MKGKRNGPWTLISLLGKGGNGEVWKARHDDGTLAALKILRNTSRSRYERFKSEIEIQRRLSGRKGILSLIQADLPNKLGRDKSAWLATPVAQKLVEIVNNAELETVVRAIFEVALTLATLAEEGMSHRDIKPDNLFWLDNTPVIGDFGLADFPEKNAVTKKGERLGPLYYMAPEMLTDAEKADGRPADVYSLAKTLWVLATGQIYPPPGELRVDVPPVRLSTYVSHPRAYLLDRLIEAATRHDPSQRPSMRALADELHSWQLLSQGDPTVPDLLSVAAKLEAVVAPLQRLEGQKREHIKQAKAELERLAVRMRSTAKLVAEIAPCNGEIGYGGDVRANCLQPAVYSGPRVPPDSVVWNDPAPYFSVISPDARRIRLDCGIGMDLLDDGLLHVAAAYILRVLDRYEVLWCESIEVHVGTAKCEEAADQLLDRFIQNLSGALQRFADEVADVSQ